MASKEKFVFGKNNVALILAGTSITALGFILMIGGGSTDPLVFDKAELFSFVRITIAPLLVIAGYVIVIYGIMKKPSVDPVDAGKANKKTILIAVGLGVIQILLGVIAGRYISIILGLMTILTGILYATFGKSKTNNQ